jgi:hypothetical protein
MKERCVAKFGVYRTPLEFVSEAKSLVHPFDQPYALDADSLQAAFDILTRGKIDTLKFRATALARYSALAKQLAAEESNLHDSLDKEVAKVIKGKRTLLLDRMLKEIAYDDPSLISDIREGFRITGDLSDCNEFPSQFKPAAVSREELVDAAVWSVETLMARMADRPCKEKPAEQILIDEAVYQATTDEASNVKGWATGPHTQEFLDLKFGKGKWVPASRFGIRQGEKIRPVDNFSEFQVNASLSSPFKVDLQGVDELVGTARAILFAVADDRSVTFSVEV